MGARLFAPLRRRAALGRGDRREGLALPDLADWLWLAEQIPLRVLAAEIDQGLHLALGLDALGERGHSVARSKFDDGADRRAGAVALTELLHERPVDLDSRDREALEIAQAREAGAEVVQGHPHAGPAHSPQLVDDALIVLHQR